MQQSARIWIGLHSMHASHNGQCCSAEILTCMPSPEVGACTIAISPTAAGTYLLDILQWGQPIGSSSSSSSFRNMPIPISIQPQAPLLDFSYYASPGGLYLTAGEQLRIGLYLHDSWGNLAQSREVAVSFQAEGGDPIAADVVAVSVNNWLCGRDLPAESACKVNGRPVLICELQISVCMLRTRQSSLAVQLCAVYQYLHRLTCGMPAHTCKLTMMSNGCRHQMLFRLPAPSATA